MHVHTLLNLVPHQLFPALYRDTVRRYVGIEREKNKMYHRFYHTSCDVFSSSSVLYALASRGNDVHTQDTHRKKRRKTRTIEMHSKLNGSLCAVRCVIQHTRHRRRCIAVTFLHTNSHH